MLLADYLHNLNPIVFEFNSWLKIHWYGLAYVMGFLAGYKCLVMLARKNIGVLEEKEIADFITYAAIFGVLLGGRLGYMLFYALDDFLARPQTIFQMQNGGMSSHGGILGLFFFTLYYAIRHRKSWPGIGDNLVSVAPLGLLFGRLANFVNGELYGNPCSANFPLAVRFPSELSTIAATDPARFETICASLPGVQLTGYPEQMITQIAVAARENPEIGQKLAPWLTPRHPSQLYEAALEGLALFVILFFIRLKCPRAPHGFITGLFFIFYAIFRMVIEKYYRVGDGVILGMSKGFFYSTFMIGIGAAFLIYAHKKRDKAA